MSHFRDALLRGGRLGAFLQSSQAGGCSGVDDGIDVDTRGLIKIGNIARLTVAFDAERRPSALGKAL